MTIAVVGGGPSGMLAAVLLARAGNDVELLDEHAQVGGHLTYDIYQLPGGGSSVVLLAELEAAVRCSGAGLGVDSVVWGAFRSVAGIELTINRMGASSSTLCQRAIFATGATNRAIALPGGTLPGVMTASAVRILGERHGVVPAERFAIIGSGDEAQRLAQDIGAWGARVEAIVNPASVRRIVGTDSVQAVELVQGTFEVDVVAIAVGELPDTQLPGMLELQRVYDPTLGGWRIEPPTGIEQVGVVGGAALGGARIGDVLRSAIDIVAGIMGAGAVQLTDLKAVNSVLWSDGEGQS